MKLIGKFLLQFYISFFRPLSSAQFKISVVAEMIHTASLLHDDVVDEATLRRGVPSVNVLYGNKKVNYSCPGFAHTVECSLIPRQSPLFFYTMSLVSEAQFHLFSPQAK